MNEVTRTSKERVSDTTLAWLIELCDQNFGVAEKHGASDMSIWENLSEALEELKERRDEPALDDHSELMKKLPNVRPELLAEIRKQSKWALERRVLIQADWLGSYSKCLDGFGLRYGVDGCWNPRDIREAVQRIAAAVVERENRARLFFSGYSTEARNMIESAAAGTSPEPGSAHLKVGDRVRVKRWNSYGIIKTIGYELEPPYMADAFERERDIEPAPTKEV